VATGSRLAAGIPGASFATIERAGHLVQLDAPVALATEPRSWLTRMTS
jgi:pimeloyl-ACP methyl ester carboxylesterase